jgi:hypothetical protein
MEAWYFPNPLIVRKNTILVNADKGGIPLGDYKIVVDMTNSKKRAQSQLNKLRNNDIACYVVPVKLNNQTFYNVQAGPFSYKKDALENVDKIKQQLGIQNAFITNNAIGKR